VTPQIGEVWEELDMNGWLVVSEPKTDHEDGTEFVVMVLLYMVDGRPSSYIGHIEGIPIHYLKTGWVRVN
jgi:hypothetical protein